MERPADTTVYRLIHRAMVDSARRLADTVQRPDHDPDAVARWAAGFVAGVHWHQAEEDTVAFPALVERVPAARSSIERLALDHQDLDELLARLGEDPAAVAGRVHDLLAAHIFDEDVTIAPMIERHLGFDEHQAQLVDAARRLPDEMAGWTVPWLLAACTPEEEPAVRALLDGRLQAVDPEPYAELERAAFG
jgi:hemerythrin-like domain-containing protein